MKLMQFDVCAGCEELARQPGNYFAAVIQGAVIRCIHTLEEDHARQEPGIDQVLIESEQNVRSDHHTFTAQHHGTGG